MSEKEKNEKFCINPQTPIQTCKRFYRLRYIQPMRLTKRILQKIILKVKAIQAKSLNQSLNLNKMTLKIKYKRGHHNVWND